MCLDIEHPESLLAYLRANRRIAPDEQPRTETLTGGVSNRAVLVERRTGEAWVVKQALSKLRVPSDWFSSPERIHREAQGLRALERLAPPGTITPLVFEDHAEHLMAMQAVPQPHHNWKTLLLSGQLVPDHIEQWGRLLGVIHREAYLRRDAIAPDFADRSFFESLRLEPYYIYTAAQVPDASSWLHHLVEETRRFQVTLVHGDYSPKNVLVHDQRLILLDHEVIHWGDPAFDLGFSLAHLLSKAHYLQPRRLAFADAAMRYCQVYRQAIGALDWTDGLEARAVRQTLGCLLARVAGRSQLEYLTPDMRSRQRAIILALIPSPPTTISALVDRFVSELNHHAYH